MQTTTNYALKTYEGTDYFNPLTVENPNAVDIDAIMKSISDLAIGTATELTTGTVHAITRSDSDQAVFRFTATSNYATGDTFTVDTVQVSALTINGQALPDEAYLAGAEVLCALVGTRMTVYGVTGSTIADDSLMLGGQLPSYYGKATDVTLAQNTATAAGTLATQLDGRVAALESAGTGLKPTVLWSNNNVANNFIGQTVQLAADITTFDFYETVCQLQAGTGLTAMITFTSGMIPKDRNTQVMSTNSSRAFVFSNDECQIGDGVYRAQYNAAGSVDNSRVIPVMIVGYKA